MRSMDPRKVELLYELAAAALDCGTGDIDAIFDMELHFQGTIDEAIENVCGEWGDSKVGFGHFVEAVKRKAIESVEDELEPDEIECLRDMGLDNNYAAWGAVAYYGKGILSEETQNAFKDYVVSGSEQDREEFLRLVQQERRAREQELGNE